MIGSSAFSPLSKVVTVSVFKTVCLLLAVIINFTVYFVPSVKLEIVTFWPSNSVGISTIFWGALAL